jgi:hypothetical protein
MPIKHLRASVLLGLLALVWAGVLVGLPSTAHANGRVTELQKKQAGPYEIALGTIPATPIVGTLHLTMTVSDRASGAFLLDARVSVTGTGPGGQVPEIGPLEAENNPISPNFYDASTVVDRVGVWTFTVSIGGDLGEASTDFTLSVETPNPLFRALTWITVVVFFALVGLGLLPLIRQRSRRKRMSR